MRTLERGLEDAANEAVCRLKRDAVVRGAGRVDELFEEDAGVKKADDDADDAEVLVDEVICLGS